MSTKDNDDSYYFCPLQNFETNIHETEKRKVDIYMKNYSGMFKRIGWDIGAQAATKSEPLNDQNTDTPLTRM